MPQKIVGSVLLIVGIVLIVASLLADVVGVGAQPGIGGRQTTGLILGIVIGIAGFVLRRRTAPKE
jgi:hypothetical protein